MSTSEQLVQGEESKQIAGWTDEVRKLAILLMEDEHNRK